MPTCLTATPDRRYHLHGLGSRLRPAFFMQHVGNHALHHAAILPPRSVLDATCGLKPVEYHGHRTTWPFGVNCASCERNTYSTILDGELEYTARPSQQLQ